MAELHTDMQAYYARLGADYDKIYAKPERQDDLEHLGDWIEECLFGQHVLELACGTGYWTQRYAELTESTLATDYGSEMLAVARARKLPADKVKFAEVDAFKLTAADLGGQKYTACFAGFFWSHVLRQDQDAFLTNLRKVLGKDTLLILADNNYVEGSSTVIARTDLEGNTFQIRTAPDGSRHEVLKNFPTDSALRKRFADHAREIRVKRNDYYWMLSCRLK